MSNSGRTENEQGDISISEQTQSPNTSSSKKTRNSSVELLRIIAMLFIISSHFSVHSGFDLGAIADNNVVSAVYLHTTALGYVGINIFMSIFGYFNITQTDYSKTVKKVIRITLQTFFYSSVLYFLLAALGLINFSVKNTIKSLLPITMNEYGFPTLYIMIALISPMINGGFNSLSKRHRRSMALICILLWSVIPTFSIGTVNYYNSKLCQYILSYILGGFIRTETEGLSNRRKTGIMFIISSVSGIVFISILYSTVDILIYSNSYLEIFISRYSPLSLMLTAGLLLVLTDISIKSKLINFIGSLTFGIYLIHDNNYIRVLLWNKLIKAADHSFDWYLPLYGFITVLCVFTVCGIIEAARQKVLGRPFEIIKERIFAGIKKIYSAAVS